LLAMNDNRDSHSTNVTFRQLLYWPS